MPSLDLSSHTLLIVTVRTYYHRRTCVYGTINAASVLSCPLCRVPVCVSDSCCVPPCASQLFMVGMKRDCGGAAGILGAFYTAVKLVSKVCDGCHSVDAI